MKNEELTARYTEAFERMANMFMHLELENTQDGDLDTRQFHREQARYEREKLAAIFRDVMAEDQQIITLPPNAKFDITASWWE